MYKNYFKGIRYKCLICYDYDLCEKCHYRGFTTGNHRTDHPMQEIVSDRFLTMKIKNQYTSIF